MASSTGIILAAGGITLADLALSGWEPGRGVKILAATVVAAFLAGGLDAAIPGLGTGSAVVLLVAVVYKSGPSLLAHLDLASTVKGAKSGGVNLDAAGKILRGN